ncbi:hypothetical protein D8S78_09385 [Natrialba swarupiae]|nr:hypothetical protein [Natrialba swarupiae]
MVGSRAETVKGFTWFRGKHRLTAVVGFRRKERRQATRNVPPARSRRSAFVPRPCPVGRVRTKRSTAADDASHLDRLGQ